MRYMKYLPLVAVLMLPLTYSQAQVEDSQAQVENEIGVPPVCAYGYYGYYPYACALLVWLGLGAWRLGPQGLRTCGLRRTRLRRWARH